MPRRARLRRSTPGAAVFCEAICSCRVTFFPLPFPLMPTSAFALDRSRHLTRRLLGIARLARPLNVALFAAGVVVGGLLGAGSDAFAAPTGALLTQAALSAALIGAGANALNDAFDVSMDRLNRPRRPIPSGQVDVRTGWILWGGATLGGVALGAAVSPAHAGMAAAAAAGLYVYNTRLKRTVLAGNLVVAGVVALSLLYGGAAVGAVLPALVGAAFAGLTTLAREIIKDIEDARGDAAAGARTLPVVHGPAVAARLAAAVIAVTVALTPFPFLLPRYSGLFLLGLLVTDGLLLRVLWTLHPATGATDAGRASSVLKAAMMAGLVALALAPLG